MDARRDQAGVGRGEAGLLEALGSVPAFAVCGPSGLRRIAAMGTEVRRGPGAVLQRAHRSIRQAMVVLEGTASEQGTSGRAQPVSTGRLLGAAALARPGAMAASEVRATTEVRLLVFGPAEMAGIADLLAEVDEARVRSAAPRRAHLLRRPRPAVVAPWPTAVPATTA